MKKTTMILCLIIGGLLILAGIFLTDGSIPMPNRAPRYNGSGAATDVTTGTEREFDTADLNAIVAETIGLDIYVWEGTDTTIQIDVPASVADRVSTWREGDTLYLREQEDDGNNSWGSEEITFWVPKGGNGTFSVVTVSGDVDFNGFRGDALATELTTGSGQLSVVGSRLGSLSCTASSGHIFVGLAEIYGPLALDTGSGHVIIDDSTAGDTGVKTANGYVSIWEFDAPSLTVETTSGSIDLELRGSAEEYAVTVSSRSGRIEGIQNRTGGERELVLSTDTGNITVSFK